MSLGEGWTPLHTGLGLSEDTDVDVWLKNETMNPTFSFKDRAFSPLLSNLDAFGVSRVATSSTGNQGASVAAYAARADLDRTLVFVADETEPPIRRQIRAYGASVVATRLDGRGELLAAVANLGWYPARSTRPYATQGYKTIAYEIFEQLGTAPDVVVFPVGAGDGLYGIWKGFDELVELGFVDDPPRLIAAQPAERAPIVKAVRNDLPEVARDPGPLPITRSNATTTGSELTLQAIRDSGGYAYSIERPAVERAIRAAGRQGTFVEPTSALPIAALFRGIEDGRIDPGETVVCVETGSGVKWPETTEEAVGTVPRIEPDLDALRSAVPFSLEGSEE